MQVYLTKDGVPTGPFSVVQLRKHMEAGHCQATDYACHDGTNWVTVADVPGITQEIQQLTEVDVPASHTTIPTGLPPPAGFAMTAQSDGLRSAKGH